MHYLRKGKKETDLSASCAALTAVYIYVKQVLRGARE